MTLRTCGCGCEQAFPPMRFHNGRCGRVTPQLYVAGHQRRGVTAPGNGHMRDVASRVVMRAVAEHGVPIPMLAAATGIPRVRLYRYRNAAMPWMRRATADAILVAVAQHAGLRREATVTERRRTVPDDPLFQTQAERVARERRRAAERKARLRAS